MRSVQVFKYASLDDYSFEELPKGNVVEIAMNPYNGNVFVKLGNRAASAEVALDVMRELLRGVDAYGRRAMVDIPSDALRSLLRECDGDNWETLTKAVRDDIRAIRGRSAQDGEDGGSEGAGQVRRVS